ncbi:alpha-galactosidase [Oribacterium sp. WCC10]|uniref:alpha-galactosidase n=1 Tax=Oribacterium sp. WCC10 TaxID=1855343 RepID=UPI0008E00429|nr:alpha-galactosidase [Oribacterium sp. WCC10]SFG42983.1 alpha-galactosidase [Oribacterium sp. WCC10]
MAITYDESKKIFTLTTNNSEYQMKVDDIGLLLHTYYGKPVYGTDMSYQIVPVDRGFSGNLYEYRMDRGRSIDTLPQEFSGCGMGDYRISSVAVKAKNGSRTCDFRYKSHSIKEGKPSIPGLPSVRPCDDEVSTLVITLEDRLTGLEAELFYSVFMDKDIITRHTRFVNASDNGMILEKAASMMLDLQYGEWDEIHFAGRHCMERSVQRNRLSQDIRVISSKRGMSSHHQNPFVILCDHTATEESGSCFGMMLMYSGNHKTEIEQDQAGAVRIVSGINDENFSWNLKSGESFDTPEVIMAYSAIGLSALSHLYHRIIRENVCDRKYLDMKRPVLINNWEATYFDFNSDKIIDIAKTASELGVEMMVLDDGWFGKRDDDNSGLGDWLVNERKLPGGLRRITDEVTKMGMKFGLWFEPEMVNEDSGLFRTHPEWALRDPGRNPNLSRNQMVLDMSNSEVVDYLFDCMKKVLDSADISYIKWDFNRSVCNVYSNALEPSRQGEVAHRFMLGTYSLLDRLTKAYPDLMIEGCAGGGGRFDAGMMYFCPQIWCSDDTDAIERLEIQEGTSFGYPVSTMGSHVSAVPNHQTGRTTPLSTRGVVAMSGTFGYELDITKLTDEEKSTIKEQIKTFNRLYPLIQKGTYYRLSQGDQSEIYKAWEFVAPDGSEALINIVLKKSQANARIKNVHLKGLCADAMYRLEGTEQVLSGAALMYGGYAINLSSGDYSSAQLHFIKTT